MAYQAQGFKDGNLLFADNLIKIENAILDLEKQSLSVDATLSHAGMAAEAAAVGTRLLKLENGTANIITSSTQLPTLPNYWYNLCNKRIPSVRQALMDAGWNKSAFFWYHDSHWQRNSYRSPELLKHLHKKVPINKTNYGGDITDLEQPDLAKLSYLWDWRTLIREIPNHHSVAGNHDDCNESESNGKWWTPQDIYAYLLGPEETAQICQGEGLYYYIDNNAERTRYIYLDTATSLGVIYKEANGQLDWLRSTLLTTPNNWHIVAISHMWKNYTSITKDEVKYYYVLKDWTEANQWYGADKALKEFALYNLRNGDYKNCSGKVEFCIGGHTHWDADYIYEYEGIKIPVIITTSDAMDHRFPYEDTETTMEDYTTTVWNGDLTQDMANKIGTTNESAVDAIVADYTNGYVSVIRFGRGTSRKVWLDCRSPIHESIEDAEINDLPTGNYINQLNLYGYIDYARISTSNTPGFTQYDSGWDTTGFIPATRGNVVSMYNITFYDTADTTNRAGVHYYDANKNYMYSYLGKPMSSSYVPVMQDGDLVEFTLPTDIDFSYIRIVAKDINEASVITINDPFWGSEVIVPPEDDDTGNNDNNGSTDEGTGEEDLNYPDDITEDFSSAPEADTTNALRSAAASLDDYTYSSETDSWSLNADATIYNNGWGYIENARISTSSDPGAIFTDDKAQKWDLTGFIPARYGTMVRLENIQFRDAYYTNTEDYAGFYYYGDLRYDGGSKNELQFGWLAGVGALGTTINPMYTPVYTEEGDLVQFTLPRSVSSDKQFIRINADEITKESSIILSHLSDGTNGVDYGNSSSSNYLHHAQYSRYPIQYDEDGNEIAIDTKNTPTGGYGFNCGRGYINDAICKIVATNDHRDIRTPGWSVTGYLPVTAGTATKFNLTNLAILSTTEGAEQLGCVQLFDADFNFIATSGPITSAETSDWVAASSDGVITALTYPVGTYSNVAYVRITAADISANSVITLE